MLLLLHELARETEFVQWIVSAAATVASITCCYAQECTARMKILQFPQYARLQLSWLLTGLQETLHCVQLP